MRLEESIHLYVRHKNALGIEFESGKKYLMALAQHTGSLELVNVNVQHIKSYLDAAEVKVSTWRLKYHVLLSFFDFWAARQEIPYLSFPPVRPKVRRTFVPYIFSRTEVKALVGVRNWKVNSCIDPITMRTFLLFLYATGAMSGEVWNLPIQDIDLKRKVATFKDKCITRSRRIPLSDDLCRILKTYLTWRSKAEVFSSRLFIKRDGKPANYQTVLRCFRKHCDICGISRERSSTYQPRLLDLKFTFAVHRITAWICSSSDLNRMLPALAAYMGLKLGSTEQYFYLTPQRFSKHLRKLSPRDHKRRWRDDPDLMAFLRDL